MAGGTFFARSAACRPRIRAWQQRQIEKRYDDPTLIPLMEPTESELEQEEAEAAAEIAARERRQAAKQEAVRPVPPEIAPQDIIFENGKAIIRPHTRMSVAVSTMRLTFQDGSEWDISADIEFAGLSEEDFRAAYAAFIKTQAELRGIEVPPPLNSKFWRDRPPLASRPVSFRVLRHTGPSRRLADGVDKVRQRVPGRQFDTIRLCPTVHLGQFLHCRDLVGDAELHWLTVLELGGLHERRVHVDFRGGGVVDVA